MYMMGTTQGFPGYYIQKLWVQACGSCTSLALYNTQDEGLDALSRTPGVSVDGEVWPCTICRMRGWMP